MVALAFTVTDLFNKSVRKGLERKKELRRRSKTKRMSHYYEDTYIETDRKAWALKKEGQRASRLLSLQLVWG